MISTYMDFGTVSASESASVMTILNANNFTTSVCVTKIDNVTYLETKSTYVCFTSFLTKKLYQAFLVGRSIENRVDRFKYYGKKFAKLPSCMPLNIHSDEQKTELFEKHNKPGASNNPWSVTLHPNQPIWKEATFPIYGFDHYIHYLLPCSETPQLCGYYANTSTNTCNYMW